MNKDLNVLKVSKLALILLMGLVVGQDLKACEELEGASLFGEAADLVHLSDQKYQGPAITDETAFNELFLKNHLHLNFDRCRDALRIFKIGSKKSNSHFIALVTYDDACDGGATQGVLLNPNMTRILGTIHDSEISCR